MRDLTPHQWKWIVIGICDILLGIAILIIRDDPIGMRGAQYLVLMLVMASFDPDQHRYHGPRRRGTKRPDPVRIEAIESAVIVRTAPFADVCLPMSHTYRGPGGKSPRLARAPVSSLMPSQQCQHTGLNSQVVQD